MGNHEHSLTNGGPYQRGATVTYDGVGRLRIVQDDPIWTMTFSYDPAAAVRCVAAPAGDAPPPAADQPPLRRALEFRLCGAETQEQTVALDGPPSGAPVVAIERLRAFLTGDGADGAAAPQIGGVEVHAELRAGRVVCTAQLSDFRPSDLVVVVQVELAVYCCGGGR